MTGLKNVRQRRDDALSRMHWAELERVLAAYYRDVGWWVEHAGTGGTGARFDGGVDLRLRRDAEIVLVQCKHWNAKQVTHNAVHELLGVMVNEGATGAILISSGEFTIAAIEAANRQGRVKLIDGDGLRAMLGTLPESPSAADPFAASVAEPSPRRKATAPDRSGGGRIRLWLFALACAVGFVLIVRAMLDRTADTAGEPPPDVRKPPRPTIVIHEARPAAVPTTVPESPQAPLRRPTEAEIRESQRKADEAIRTIEETTPEL
ncbi:MAG: restriction endonuclease [Pseudomonadota bacterium]